MEMTRIPVPIVGIVIGEGGSGGALALGVCDRVLMMENAVYSVISPEGCAAILWGDRSRAAEAADALRLTAQDLAELGVVDGIVPEPSGGAHRDLPAAARSVGDALDAALRDLAPLEPRELLRARLEKFRRIGPFLEENTPPRTREP
jgi:acetyl-CoA carboxylase carboxyl transferase subunit alpha